jgi:4-hydroxybenzoyl-CoA thioesterase
VTTFKREILVRFAHCDAAGWVFYPRYFEMVSDLVEDWFAAGLGADMPQLLHRQGLLTPSVHFTVDFPKPARFGDLLLFTLAVLKVGRASCELQIEASLDGATRLRMRQVLVLISAATGRPIAIPPRLIRRMQKFLVAAAPAPTRGRRMLPGRGTRSAT